MLTCHASHGLLQPPRLDLGKTLVEAQEAVQRHLLLIVIISLHSSSCSHGDECLLMTVVNRLHIP